MENSSSLTSGQPSYPMIKPIDTNCLEILADVAFQQSCHMVRNITLLDTPRLANLWALCKLTDPNGGMLEVGTYLGGGALHLSNCCPDRKIIVCDPFDEENFEKINPHFDKLFHKGMFSSPGMERISLIFQDRNAELIKGYFPDSIRSKELPKISFVHLDVDVYQATRDSLFFLLSQQFLCKKSLIVLDDYNRGTGVNQAVSEVLEVVKGTMAFPMFPGQALIIPATWTA